MDRWKYKFSFFSGILFIITFFLKELVVNSPEIISIFIFIFPFLFMIIYNIGLFLAFIKYSILNEKYLLKISTIFYLIFYTIIVSLEFYDRVINLTSSSPSIIIVTKIFVGFSLIFLSIILFLQKKIYGKSTILQSLSGLLLGISFFTPYLSLFQLPFFLIFYISITYLVNKKIKEKNVYKGRLL